MIYPQIANYTQAIQQNGVRVFRTLRAEAFEPSRERPIKIFHYGAGMFAVVFKVKISGRYKAVRCFLSSADDAARRYQLIGDHCSSIPSQDWKLDFTYMDREMQIDGVYYPIVLMDWVDGMSINKYVTVNLNNRDVLTELQRSLVDLAGSLARNNMAHGDLQSGNIFITPAGRIKLIDYDSMYVPALRGSLCNEVGRPEYQHPRRTRNDYNERIDWFSIWVMLTAIEAVKTDANLWKRGFEGGFNTTDNFLFLGEDFLRPEQSRLFRTLLDKRNDDLAFYTDKLLSFCRGSVKGVQAPALCSGTTNPAGGSQGYSVGNANGGGYDDSNGYGSNNGKLNDNSNDYSNSNGVSGVFVINSNTTANVMTQTLQKISTTPCELDKTQYSGKNIVVVSNGKSRTIKLIPDKDFYNVEFN